jgi:hypothetical protein
MTIGRLLVLVAAIGLSGCVRHERYRYVQPQDDCFSPDKDPFPDGSPRLFASLDCRDVGYQVGFVEFDQQGKLVEPLQQKKALALITAAKKRLASKKVITLVYVHGWKNNANEARPGGKDQDVERFRKALRGLSLRARAASPDDPVPIVGVYVAWKGKSLMGPGWFTWLSYWDRRNTANRIGTDPLTALLNEAIETTVPDQDHDPSRVMLVGHSFGARVLEHAIENGVKLYEPEKVRRAATPVRPRVDLVLYVNAATDARLSLHRLQDLQTDPITVRHPDYDPAKCTDKNPHDPICRSYPLLVAISSRGDAATKFVQPVANTINMDAGIPITLPTGTFADKVPSTRGIKRGAPGHMRFMQSHAITEIACPVSPKDAPRCTDDDPACAFAFRTAGECDACFKASRRPSEPVKPFNDTAFWIMDVDDRVIKDHGDIWNLSTLNMLGQLMAPRGFFEPTVPQMRILREAR